MTDFDHDRLHVYQAAIESLILAEGIATRLPRGRAYMADQLRRAALSIVLNIAEGAGEFAPADKARFYRMARRSATECAAVVDAARVLRLADDEEGQQAREMLKRTVAMLTPLIINLEDSGTRGGVGPS